MTHNFASLIMQRHVTSRKTQNSATAFESLLTKSINNILFIMNKFARKGKYNGHATSTKYFPG